MNYIMNNSQNIFLSDMRDFSCQFLIFNSVFSLNINTCKFHYWYKYTYMYWVSGRKCINNFWEKSCILISPTILFSQQIKSFHLPCKLSNMYVSSLFVPAGSPVPYNVNTSLLRGFPWSPSTCNWNNFPSSYGNTRR